MLKLNLQHFAEAGTLVNATGSYINAYDGSSKAFEGANTLTPTMKTYYDTELLENARAELVHTQFGKKQPLPAHRGKTVEWRKWNTLADAPALTEGVIPTGQKLGQSSITVPIAQYGTYVTVSDQLELHAVDDVILGAAEELGASAGSTMDKLARNALCQGTNVIYADKVSADGTVTEVTSRSGLDKTAKLTPAMINRAVTYLKKMKAPKIDGKYMAIIHPSVGYDLRQSEEWIEAHKYASPEEIYNGEIGELHGVRFIETTEAKIVGVTTGEETKAVYLSLFFGKDAYGEIDPDGGGMEMIIKDKSEAGGPLNQFSTLGYKFSTAFKILYEDRMVRVESCSDYSDVDEEN
ncbi:MAG: N4-gp56 family major capsid protein [Clostridia bacterium]|nr:N4-gp56 family major capsid protein [Clostridia bacterium]